VESCASALNQTPAARRRTNAAHGASRGKNNQSRYKFRRDEIVLNRTINRELLLAVWCLNSQRRRRTMQTARPHGIVSLLILFCCVCLILRGVSESQVAAPETQGRPIHGTIVVVVSTKDGFVLAGDSRGLWLSSSNECVPAPGEYEKVFSLGKRAAIVVAGTISASSGDLNEALSTEFHAAEQMYGPEGHPQATEVAWRFYDAVGREFELFDPDALAPQSTKASVVSINDKGGREWITLAIVPVVHTVRGGGRVVHAKVEEFQDPPASQVISLGSGSDVVQPLLEVDDPDDRNPYSQGAALKRYYELKKAKHLSDLTLPEGEELAKSLVGAAINEGVAHPCMGVGGSIDILIVTKSGIQWKKKKQEVALSPPLYNVRVVDSPMYGVIDGGEWLRGTVPINGRITFNGEAPSKVVQPKFSGACTFVLGKDAQNRMPSDAVRLKALFEPHCDVYIESHLGKRKLSSATRPTSSTQPLMESETYHVPYSSVPDSCLRVESIALAEQINRFADTAWSGSSLTDGLQEMQIAREEDRSVFALKRDLLKQDQDAESLSEYESKIVPRASSIQRELLKRTRPSDEHRIAEDIGVTSFEMYDVARDIHDLAERLPSGVCAMQ
jgi:hypothetical protein